MNNLVASGSIAIRNAAISAAQKTCTTARHGETPRRCSANQTTRRDFGRPTRRRPRTIRLWQPRECTPARLRGVWVGLTVVSVRYLGPTPVPRRRGVNSFSLKSGPPRLTDAQDQPARTITQDTDDAPCWKVLPMSAASRTRECAVTPIDDGRATYLMCHRHCSRSHGPVAKS